MEAEGEKAELGWRECDEDILEPEVSDYFFINELNIGGKTSVREKV